MYHLRLLCIHAGLGGLDLDFQVFGVEARQHLIGLNVITDIDLALDDLAADPKGQLGFDPGLNVATERNGRCIVAAGNFLYINPW